VASAGRLVGVDPRPGDGSPIIPGADFLAGAQSKEGVSPMSVLRTLLASLRRDEEGQGLAEYALILALIAIVAIIALIFLGGQVSQILSTVGGSV
jgi:pilus assembly protein Flp/PilA